MCLFHGCLQAFTLFATHFLELCQLETLYPNVENQHMEVQHTRSSSDSGTDSVVYTYLLQRGCSEDRHYGTQAVKRAANYFEEVGDLFFFFFPPLPGLRAAEMTSLPSDIIKEAKTVVSKVSQQLLVRHTNVPS